MAKKTDKKIQKKNSKTKKTKQKKTGIYLTLIIAIMMIVTIAYIFSTYVKETFFENPLEASLIVAKANGKEITLKEVNEAYNGLSDQYKSVVTREDILDEIITERLLLQEAEKQGITATREEAVVIIDDAIIQSQMSEEEFQEQMDSFKISKDYLVEYYRKQIIISRLLNATLFKGIDVSDKEINQFYDKNQLAFQNITLEDSRDEIHELLLSDKKKSAYLTYLSQLKAKADIETFLDKPLAKTQEATNSFEETGDSICTKENKPIIRLYTTTSCQSCKWIKETFDSFAEQYQEQGKIVAYHWELNTGDNTLTEEKERGIPRSELDIFKKYNSKSTVPTFVFGCRYLRVGNDYEDQDDLGAEKLEFDKITNMLIT